MELSDFPSWLALTARNVQVARHAGALAPLEFGLHHLALVHIYQGDLDTAARLLAENDLIGEMTGRLAEAASRSGDSALAGVALQWLSERRSMAPTDWAAGMEARGRALLSEGDAAEAGYRESIECLVRSGFGAQVARAHLLYGEWLRRQSRRSDARVQLRTAYEMLTAMGAEGFAERARQELVAAGETARRHSVQTVTTLTAQEALIAQLARDGHTD